MIINRLLKLPIICTKKNLLLNDWCRKVRDAAKRVLFKRFTESPHYMGQDTEEFDEEPRIHVLRLELRVPQTPGHERAVRGMRRGDE
jgi:hypothetical protein